MGTLILVRHGQASFLEADYDKLSTIGEAQARELGAYWARRRVTFDAVFVGPKTRHARTAALAGEAYTAAGGAFPTPTPLPDLDEMQAEALLKRTLPDLAETDPVLAAAAAGASTPEGLVNAKRAFQRASEGVLLQWARGELDVGVEPWAAFCARVERGLSAMTRPARKGFSVAAFTSSGPVAASVRLALRTTDDAALGLIWRLYNASITEFAFSGPRFTLTGYNAVPHLEDPALLSYV